MKRYSTYVGLDVHANSISVAVAPAGGGEVRSLGVVANDVGALRKLLKKVGDFGSMKVCYGQVHAATRCIGRSSSSASSAWWWRRR